MVCAAAKHHTLYAQTPSASARELARGLRSASGSPRRDRLQRCQARCEDRIRALKDTGLRNLPFAGFAQNRLWAEGVALAADLLTWTQTLAFDESEPARRWEPKRLRFRILAVAGRIINSQRRRRLRLPRNWPWNHLIDTGWHTIRTA